MALHQTTEQHKPFLVSSHAIQPMPVNEDEAPVFTAEELLTIDEVLLVQYMEHSARDEGGFDISSASGLEMLVRHQRDELVERLK